MTVQKIKFTFTTNHVKLITSLIIIFIFAAIGSGALILRDDTVNPGASASAAYPADINNDGTVGIADIAYVAGKWGTSDVTADLTKDGAVGILDVSYIATRWGAVPATSTKPNATNTGVPAGTALRSITTAYPDATTKGYTINAQGRVTITKDGGVYENLLLPDGVWIKAKNVIIRNSRIVSGRSSFANLPPEPTSWDSCRNIRVQVEAGVYPTASTFVLDATNVNVTNFILEDSEIAVDEYSIYIGGYMGHDTIMRRVDISGGVDGIGTYNGSATAANFTLEDSYIHDLYRGLWSVGNKNTNPLTGQSVYCGYDAAHPEATHNDGIQMHGGINISILRNTINPKPVNHSQANAGIMMNAAGNVLINGNHFQYGICSINMVSGLALPITVSNNTFYGNNGSGGTGGQNDSGCAIIRPAAAGYIFTNNLWQIGSPIKLTNG
jgi:hypothetical protein